MVKTQSKKKKKKKIYINTNMELTDPTESGPIRSKWTKNKKEKSF